MIIRAALTGLVAATPALASIVPAYSGPSLPTTSIAMPNVETLLDGGVVVATSGGTLAVHAGSFGTSPMWNGPMNAGPSGGPDAEGIEPGVFLASGPTTLQAPGEGSPILPPPVTTTRPQPKDDGSTVSGPAVPLPGAGLMGAVGLAAVAGASRRRRL